MLLRVLLATVFGLSVASTLPPAAHASDSSQFDRACVRYYQQGNDAEVPEIAATDFCQCLGEWFQEKGLGKEALDFFGRTYSEDLTTFIHEYPQGEAWMEESFRADTMCKSG